jgi:hypothetical protein
MIAKIDSSEDKTFRALLALQDDMTFLGTIWERVRLQYNALAERHGLPPRTPIPPRRGDTATRAVEAEPRPLSFSRA